MRFEVVYRDERLAARQGQGFCRGQPHNDAADETRTRRRRDPVEVRQFGPGAVERALHKPINRLDMSPRGNLRHDAAEGRVLGDLAHDLVR